MEGNEMKDENTNNCNQYNPFKNPRKDKVIDMIAQCCPEAIDAISNVSKQQLFNFAIKIGMYLNTRIITDDRQRRADYLFYDIIESFDTLIRLSNKKEDINK